jgi:hypothetical protein
MLGAGTARADFSFAALGDTPYTEEEERQFPALIASMNREPLQFVVHVGDFKSGWSPCTDAVFKQRLEWFMLSHHPFIFVPGDNEWTDCQRAFGARRDPLERLQKLRQMFAGGGHALGQRPLALTRQGAAFPEHARWRHEAVLFVTLNVPGGNNLAFPAEAAARNKALAAWIMEAFALAREEKLRAVVLFMQANPFMDDGRIMRYYTEVMAVVQRESSAFDGEVLLVHGDTHRYRVDQPLFDPKARAPLKNFTRLEVHGYPFMNWVRVRVHTAGARVRFETTPGQ